MSVPAHYTPLLRNSFDTHIEPISTFRSSDVTQLHIFTPRAKELGTTREKSIAEPQGQKT